MFDLNNYQVLKDANNLDITVVEDGVVEISTQVFSSLTGQPVDRDITRLKIKDFMGSRDSLYNQIKSFEKMIGELKGKIDFTDTFIGDLNKLNDEWVANNKADGLISVDADGLSDETKKEP